MVREIEVGLIEMYNKCGALLNRANKHLHYLGKLVDNSFTYDSHEFRMKQEQLEDEMVDFVKEFRATRKEVFEITEDIMETGKLTQLLKS